MTGYTHVLAGALMVSALAGPEANVGLLAASGVGALAADLDSFASPLAARTLVGNVAAAALRAAGARHRGPTHSIAALFIFSFLVRVGAAMLGNVPAIASLSLNVPAYGSALILGYVSHLAIYMFLMFDLVKTGTAVAGALIVILTVVDKVEFIFNR